MDQGRIKNFSQPIGTQSISHLGFADDILIFCNASKTSIRNLKDYIEEYQKVSGQLLNANKCTFIISKEAKNSKIRYIEQFTGFKNQDLPMKYLGCPIFPGRMKVHYFNDLINAIRNKVQGWSTNLLNQAGRMTLIAHVLQSMTIHICAAIAPPMSVLNDMDRILSRCFWSNSENHIKHHWIAWKKICKPKKEGGLGIKSIHDIIRVQSLKICWKLITDNSIWANFMNVKYNRELRNDTRMAKTSNNWKRIRSAVDEARSLIEENNGEFKWSPSNSGKFNTKLTWKHIRGEEYQPIAFKYIWNQFTPNKVAIFMWKLLHRKLPLDDNIRKCSVSIVSRCLCCKNYKEETQNHLFYAGETAKEVWKHFQDTIDMHVGSRNLDNHLKMWWFRASKSEKEAIIFHCIPSVICWGLWKSRNKAMFEDIQMKASTIIEKTKDLLRNLFRIYAKDNFSYDLKRAMTNCVKP